MMTLLAALAFAAVAIHGNVLAADGRAGLSESQRQAVFVQLVQSEDAAQRECETRFPEPDPLKKGYSQERWRKMFDLREDCRRPHQKKSRARLLTKHNLSEKTLRAISIEGVEKGWLRLVPR